MAKIRKFLKQRGFTLIEILVVIVIIGVLSIMGVSKYTEFTTTSRIKGCQSNQNSIDKAVGVWESQNVAIPTLGTHAMNFSALGSVVAPSAGLVALKAPVGDTLIATSKTIYNFTKDLNVFSCPERVNLAGSDKIAVAGEIDYGWRIDSVGIAALNNKTRGTVCIEFNGNGPDGTTATQHR